MSSTQSDSLVIACAADAYYVKPLAAMVKSILINIQTPQRLSLYIVDGGIHEEDKERLAKSWISDRLEVKWVLPDHSKLSDLPVWGRMNISTYFRVLIPSLLPESCGKAIWLDSDLIVTGNLAELWATDVGEKSLLAVQDLVIPYVSSCYGIPCYKELGISPDAKYFNAGVMVVNLDWWRRQAVTDRVLAYLRKYLHTVYFWDQEGLNAVLTGQWGELDPRWNQISSVSGRRFFPIHHLDRTVYQQVITEPYIVHFAGSFKPWLYHNDNPARALYFQYLDRTAWAGWRPRKTLRSLSLGFYESVLREIFYPAEKWRMRLIRRRG